MINGPINGKLSYEDFVKLMFHLGFVVNSAEKQDKFSEAQLSKQENKLLSKIWAHLKGKFMGYVSLTNIKTYLAAILNLNLNWML